MLLELLPSKLVFPPRSPPLNLTYFPDYVRNPDEIPSIQCDFSVLEWLAMTVLLSSLFLSGRVLQVLERETIPFFSFYGKDGEDRARTSLLTVHDLTYILSATPLWGSRQKMLRNKCYSSYCLVNSFFHHSGDNFQFFYEKLKNVSCEYDRLLIVIEWWLKLNFASCVVHQASSSLDVLIICFIYNTSSVP